MNGAFNEIKNALSTARAVNNAADAHANDMAELLRGRLRNVSAKHLAELKHELRDFDMRKNKWRKP